MRMLALPAAFALSFLLYPLLPACESAVFTAISRIYSRMKQRSGSRALGLFLLLLGAAASLLGAVHPAAAAMVMTPLFTASSVLPACGRMKADLDSGKFSGNIPAYEENVRKTCLSLGPAFLSGAAAPMILCAVGMPLYIGCGLGWVYTALRLLYPESLRAKRALALLLRISDKCFSFMLMLSAGVVGRSPLCSRGSDAKSHILSILGIAEDGADTHDPVSGDIAQGIFLCCFSLTILCFALTAVGFVLCRF